MEAREDKIKDKIPKKTIKCLSFLFSITIRSVLFTDLHVST